MSKYGQGRGGRHWRRLRDQVLLRDQYTCQRCHRPCLAEELQCDHKLPLANGGKSTPDNLQALCIPCHEAKTAEDCGIKLKQPVGIDGWPESIGSMRTITSSLRST